MTKEEILIEMELIQTESNRFQSQLVQELRELEKTCRSDENRRRMAEISVLHAKDLSNTLCKICELEFKLKLL